MITIIISQYIAYTTYVLIISHVFHSCKVGSHLKLRWWKSFQFRLEAKSLLLVFVRRFRVCTKETKHRFGTVTLRISFWGEDGVGVRGVKFMIFFFMAAVRCSTCAGNSCNQRLNIYLREPLKQNWTQWF